jgi:hypothetical protein
MAHVPGFLYDVFVSYAQANDEPDKLIQEFKKLLSAAIPAEGLPLERVLNFFEEKAVYSLTKEATRLGWHPKNRIQLMSPMKSGSFACGIWY